MLLHFTDTSPDGDPDELDALIDGNWRSVGEVLRGASTLSRQACGTRSSFADFGMGEPALYTASVVLEQGLSCAHMFAALMAFDEEDAKAKLGLRVGREQAGAAQFRRGFDSSDPVACSLLSDPLTEILLDVREDGRPTLAAGLETFLEQRFKN